jgi:hypothetical protein
LKITFDLLALFSVVMVYPFQSTNFPGIVRWQVKPFNPGQRRRFDRQIDARFAVISYGRPPSFPVAARPICGTPTAAAYVSLPAGSPELHTGTKLG